MAVLYQKYRPQRFSDVVGQEHIVKTLVHAAASGQLAHAYLLTGSRGVGKTTIARLLAKAANCTNLQDGDPCAACQSCLAIAADNFLDVVEIDAASHTGVDNIRELIEHVQFKPSSGRIKVFIIDEVHMLSKAAFNALLKTLEEPPSHAMFILATTDIEKVPDTIISRTQRFDFRKISPESMLEALERIALKENMQLPEGTAALIVTNAEGGMRDALSLLDTIKGLGKTVTMDDVQSLLGLTQAGAVSELVLYIFNHDAKSIPPFFTTLSTKGTDFNSFNKSVLEYLRTVLVMKVTGVIPQNSFVANKDEHSTHQSIAALATVAQIIFVVRLFLRAHKEYGQSPIPELPMLLSSIEASLHGIVAAPEQLPQASVNKSASTTTPSFTTASTAVTPKPTIFSPLNNSKAIADEIISNFVNKTNLVEETIVTESLASEANLIDNVNQDFGITATKEEVLLWWPELVQRIRTVNSPLATLLKNSPLHDVSNGKITIAVRYLFHKEHLENIKHAALILETIAAICGKRLSFKTIIVKEKNEPLVTQSVDAISDAIKIFGGELIE